MSNVVVDRNIMAAKFLIQARISGPIDQLPEYCRPTNLEDVYAIQDAVASEFGPVLGWKVGAANTKAEPICAPLLSGTLYEAPAFLDPEAFTMRGIESEIAFRFSSALPPQIEPYTESAVLNAVEAAFPAIEVCETRYRNSDAVDSMCKHADNISNGALVLGSAWMGWRDLKIDKQPVELKFDNEVVISHYGGNSSGDIFRLVVWVANHLSQRGIGIAQGQVITTGSWTGLLPSRTARKVHTSFAGIGNVQVVFNNRL